MLINRCAAGKTLVWFPYAILHCLRLARCDCLHLSPASGWWAAHAPERRGAAVYDEFRIACCKLQDDCGNAAVGIGKRIDDFADCLTFAGLMHGAARYRRVTFDAGNEQAALQRAEVVQARDDFLAGVAALVEADTAEQVEIRHMRAEMIAGFRQHDGNATFDNGASPVRTV